ncbi:MAG: efflux RND transporter permease subunit [Rhodocyclaceae bacterium]|nr:efflux RND transporter permease subunit [Rhodocyclaceae bacterium]MCA3024076.1 efflux RND transporter permease subunit [Rhodocyclaceae bacterium]MCA3033219.1 efflux RND transporter permease subunit [Rhodocyclaceae bacterium]MCA3036654.1 efflux RND transporter permease subunit [Rhodocyclaceae bacterium]MCA3046760.1 efflux RND transporter permease subunit [Rhodocyclaceae bacterium]
MVLSDVCIKRPVFAAVLSLAILLVGMISYSRLAVRELPKIDQPIVTVTTSYRGASADVMESQVTKPLEDSLSGIEGVDILTSSSRAEQSDITITFKLSRDPDSAAADVRDKVSRVRGRLPQLIDEPVLAKTDADAFPILFIAFSSDRHTQMEQSDYANLYIRPRLGTLPGAADVRINGERKSSMRIWLDRGKLAAYKITTGDVEDAIRRQNVEIPAGRIESAKREFNVLSQTDLATPEQFGAIIVKDAGGYQVRVRDVAKVEVAPANERVITRFRGMPAISLGVIRQSTANTLDLAVAVRREVAEINKTLPPGMKLSMSYDSAVFIEESTKNVFRTIIEAMVLVALVIFIFLRNLRATLIPLVTIPISLIGTFTLLYAAGFSINVLTLLAMVLAIGLVVDDAIVVLENIYRNIEKGMEPVQAALLGSKEIGFAIIAMTLTLAAVFIPLAFGQTRTDRLFIEFALALAGAVIVSGFVALTLSPMMCSKLLRHEPKHGKVYNTIEAFFEWQTEAYKRLLAASLDRRWIGVVIWAVFAGVSAPLFLNLKSELAPLEDRGVIFGPFSAPEGSTIDYTAQYSRQMEAVYAGVTDATRYFVNSGNPSPDAGFSILILKPWAERTKSSAEIANEIRPKFRAIPGINAFPVTPPSLGGGRDKPVQFVVMTQAPYPELALMVARLQDEARKSPVLLNVDSDLRLSQPELRVNVNREKLGDLGIPVDTVGRTLETMLGGRVVTRFKQDGEQYDVIVQVTPDDRNTPTDISDIFVRSRSGDMVPLSNVTTLREGVSPRNLNHFNRLRSATVNAEIAPGYSLKEALDVMDAAAAKVLPQVQTDVLGQSREFKEGAATLLTSFALALCFIYLVLAAQFESFVDPFVILLTVPLSITGALMALWLTNNSLNVFSKIGLITLVGLITKHGILIVEFANQLQEQGKSVREAVIEAAVLRLRPILMTTGATVLGALPLAIASGAGAESRQQIGWVIVGGMTLGTLLTLFVVPTFYTVFARGHQRRGHPSIADQAKQDGLKPTSPVGQQGD